MTGEVVGQVASQTLDNMAVIASATTLPILRPLVGMDKDEIVAQAEAIGTYPISIIPDQDCCQLFTPRNPATRARLDDVEAAEAALPVEELRRSGLSAGAVTERFRFPLPAVGVGSQRVNYNRQFGGVRAGIAPLSEECIDDLSNPLQQLIECPEAAWSTVAGDRVHGDAAGRGARAHDRQAGVRRPSSARRRRSAAPPAG